MYQIDMKFDRQLRPATETSWVVSYGGETIPRRRTAPFSKSLYRHISAKNHPISMNFCTEQQILNWMNVTWSKMKLHWTDSSSIERISCYLKKQVRTSIVLRLLWRFFIIPMWEDIRYVGYSWHVLSLSIRTQWAYLSNTYTFARERKEQYDTCISDTVLSILCI